MQNEIVRLIIEIIVAVIAALIAKYVIPALRKYTEKEEYQEFIDMIRMMVEAAEQTFKEPGMGTTKKETVMNWIYRYLESKKILTLTDDEKNRIDAIIESMVYTMNQKKS